MYQENYECTYMLQYAGAHVLCVQFGNANVLLSNSYKGILYYLLPLLCILIKSFQSKVDNSMSLMQSYNEAKTLVLFHIQIPIQSSNLSMQLFSISIDLFLYYNNIQNATYTIYVLMHVVILCYLHILLHEQVYWIILNFQIL